MSGWKRGVAIGAVSILLLAVFVRVGTDRRARGTNASTTKAARAELAAERVRLATLRLPPAAAGVAVVEGVCKLDPAPLGYLREHHWMEVASAAKDSQFELPPSAEATLRRFGPKIAQVAEGLRCDRLDPAQLTTVSASEHWRVASVLVADGHVKVRDRKIADGVTRYLEAARVCAVANDTTSFCETPFLAIARSASSHDEAPLEHIESFLAALAPSLPSGPREAKHLRLAFEEAAEVAHDVETVSLSAPKYGGAPSGQLRAMRAYSFFVPQSVRYANALDTVGAIFRRIEALPDDGNSTERRAIESDANVLPDSANPFITDLALGVSMPLAPVARRGRIAFQLAQAVVRIERARRVARVPQTLSEPWARDPATDASPFRYEVLREGSGYRLWSVGINGQDEGGRQGDDVLVFRP